MVRRTLSTLLAALLLASLVVLPSSASAKAFDVVSESFSVKTRHGLIYLEVTRPMKGDKMVKGPAVLTYSPYSAIGRSNVATGWVPQGYVSVFADVVGTGNSGGCYDYGGKREKETGYDIVEWIAKQPWSNGKVGMIGGSYNGTTATATATMNPPHLETIVPEAAISRWYGYAYSGGIRYSFNNELPADEGFDTPLLFDFGFAIPPPLDVEDPAWAEKVASTVTPCDEIEHTTHGYDDTPDYDKFWLERDYLVGPDNVKDLDIPVLIAHNWGDYNVKQEEAINLFRALKKSKSPKVSLYMGNRYEGHGTPGGDYDKTVRAWFDHYLMGKDNGIEKLPEVTSHMADYDGATKWYSGKWPNTKDLSLYAQEFPRITETDWNWRVLPTKPVPGFLNGEAKFPSTGINAEAHANHHGRATHDWFWFESPMFKKDTRIFGEIKVKIWSHISREWVTVTPTVVDMDMSCHETIAGQHNLKPECLPRALHSVTRGFLDSRYRNGLSKQVLIKPGISWGTTIETKPVDYTFKKHHQLALNIQTEINEWMVPKPYPGCAQPDPTCVNFYIDWQNAETKIILPVVGTNKPSKIFYPLGKEHNHG